MKNSNKLLEKYMLFVLDCEGTDFIFLNDDEILIKFFSNEEIIKLRKLSKTNYKK